ncbi:c-type cytochrome [Campylobacter gastrosuis]|uniref:Cytochrome C oxidase subunit III n=1 Tax=Campylobacter gastrosuis TaxID=2974576 RepID=A0ABT7HS90_9BACT|nr:c-type cytochrome [Campylobacter gastrosuis]MDL0089694.1 cytochrome C oxidase subunit III [Campylobacter gastrosuis]
MRSLFFIFFVVSLSFGADFITKTEYAKMLYINPRGIGCISCHGKNAEGKVISKYKEKNRKTKQVEQKELISPRINNVSFERFKKALDEPKNIMPSYFLTDEETKILYDYTISLDKDGK